MWLSFPAFLYVAGFAGWCWMAKGKKFTRTAEQAYLDRLAASRATDYIPNSGAGVETGSTDEEKKAGLEDAQIEDVHYNRV